MYKEDLRGGNIVETRDGEKYIFNYIEGKSYFICLDRAGFNPSKYYKNDLSIDDSNRESDIVKVYKDYTLKELLWERKEPIKLTEDEKVILRNLNKRFKYIVKDNDNDLYLYQEEPRKANYGRWINDNDYESFIAYNHLFKFMTSDKPYLIEDLLKEELENGK